VANDMEILENADVSVTIGGLERVLYLLEPDDAGVLAATRNNAE